MSALIVAITMAVGACGEDDQVPRLSGPSTGQGEDSRSDASDAPSASEDRATASRVELRPSDLPDFEVIPRLRFTEVFDECSDNPLLPGNGGARHPEPASFYFDNLEKFEVDTAQSRAVLAENEEDARVALEELRDEGYRSCTAEAMAEDDEDVVAGDQGVTASAADLEAPDLGDEAVALRVSVSRGSGRRDERELTAIRQGRTLIFLLTSRDGIGDSFPADERQRLAQLLVDRIPA